MPEECRTEVFFLPAASHVEKEGTFTQTQRLLQWREKAVEPPGDARSELWFFYHLGRMLREKLADSTLPRDRALLDLTWDYPTHGPHAEPSAEAVLREINGYDVADRPSAVQLRRGEATTAPPPIGCWIYTGVYADGVNQAARRKSRHEQDWVAAEWGWAWPANRRILYNRASADPDGNPWSERKTLRLVGRGQGRVDRLRRAGLREDEAAVVPAAAGRVRRRRRIAGDDPFVMQGDGKGWLYAPSGVLDGPLPTHYEPAESPVRNPLYRQQANPTRKVYAHPVNSVNPSPPQAHSEVFPYVFTVSRLTEHHTAGGMSRTVRPLAELQPEMFVEVSPELAAEAGLAHLGWAHLVSGRAVIEAKVLVTDRLTPLRVDGRIIHQVWLPYHFGYEGLVTGDSANDLFGITLDPNVLIQESKVGTCDVRPGRRPTGTGAARPGRRLPTAVGDRADHDHRWARADAVDHRQRPARTDAVPPDAEQPVRAARPGARRRLRGRAAADGVLHRHQRLHRLQGVRGGLQGVERRPGLAVWTCWACRTTTPAR